MVTLGFPMSNEKTVSTGSGAKVHTEVSCMGRSVEFKADVCLCGFPFFYFCSCWCCKTHKCNFIKNQSRKYKTFSSKQ